MSEEAETRLPAAVIPGDKITGYLLNLHHREGGAKASYFVACGFDPAAPESFIEALLEHGEAENLVSTTESEFGTKYVCEGALRAPRGFTRPVRSVWQKKPGDVWRFLVTAYPF